MNISEEGIQITRRFFAAVERLKQMKRIRGLQTFTREHGINRWNMVTLREDPGNRVLKPEWICYLVKDYGVSAEWIITGKGEMFNQKIK